MCTCRRTRLLCSLLSALHSALHQRISAAATSTIIIISFLCRVTEQTRMNPKNSAMQDKGGWSAIMTLLCC